MNVYEGIIQGLTEALDYQQGKIPTQKTILTIKPLYTFYTNEIKRIIQKIQLSQVVSADSLGVLLKTVETWENSGNKLNGASRLLPEIVTDNLGGLWQFRAESAS